jgi:hypothetical protein
VSDDLARLRRNLLNVAEGSPGEARPGPDAVGARDGVGVDFANGAHVNLYVFDNWDDANRVANQLADRGDADRMYRCTAANGAVLFEGSIAVDGSEDMGPQFTLNGLVSAFAGRE